jgi:hypothetical protein
MAGNSIQARSRRENDRLADRILARINTRENSTLTIATVTASGSLVLLGLVVSTATPGNSTSHLFLRFGAFAVATLGILYRETTILTVDRCDWAQISQLEDMPEYHPRGGRTRRFLIRCLFLSSLAATLRILSDALKVLAANAVNAPVGQQPWWLWWLPLMFLIIAFWLVFFPGLRFGDSSEKKIALIGLIPIIFMLGFAYSNQSSLSFAFAAAMYVASTSILLTLIEQKP